jgi:hypothetical protein
MGLGDFSGSSSLLCFNQRCLCIIPKSHSQALFIIARSRTEGGDGFLGNAPPSFAKIHIDLLRKGFRNEHTLD